MAVQRAQLTGTVLWSNGATFDGMLRLGLVLPVNSDGVWPSAALAGAGPSQRLPIWTEVPIRAGEFDPACYVFLNASLDPPNTTYVAYWYDLNRRRIFPTVSVSPTPFTISTNPYAISIPTLTVPTAAAPPANIPTTVDSTTTLSPVSGALDDFFVATGGQTSFTASGTLASFFLVFRNGIKQRLGGPNDFTVTGNSVIFNSALSAGELVEIVQ